MRDVGPARETRKAGLAATQEIDRFAVFLPRLGLDLSTSRALLQVNHRLLAHAD